jgi:predicted TPR repeat methyltransferase
MSKNFIEDINKYYTNKVISYGATPQGVDWNGIESQETRFFQLLKIVDDEPESTLLDYGCGFGSLLAYVRKINKKLKYVGFDISTEMIKKAHELYGDSTTWKNRLEDDLKYDYVIASGLFNVKLEQNENDWQDYVIKTLDIMNSISNKGFAFNILTTYSDNEFTKDYLYYASPEFYFRHCKLNYSKQVSLLHDYGLYEFTISVSK